MLSALYMAYTSASKTSLLVPRWKRRLVHPPRDIQTHAAPTPALSSLEPSTQMASLRLRSYAVCMASVTPSGHSIRVAAMLPAQEIGKARAEA